MGERLEGTAYIVHQALCEVTITKSHSKHHKQGSPWMMSFPVSLVAIAQNLLHRPNTPPAPRAPKGNQPKRKLARNKIKKNTKIDEMQIKTSKIPQRHEDPA